MADASLAFVLCFILCAFQVYLARGEFCQDPHCTFALWQGCYPDDGRIVSVYGYEELFRGNQSCEIKEWKHSLPELACKCAEAAYQAGFEIFALKFQSVCYGREEGFNVTLENIINPDPKYCVPQHETLPCSRPQSICIGTRSGISIYKIVKTRKGIAWNSYFTCNASKKRENTIGGQWPCTATIDNPRGTSRPSRVEKQREESKAALLRLYELLDKALDVDEILALLRRVIKILKRPEIYQSFKVYKEMEEALMDVISNIVGDKYKEMWRKAQKIQSLVTLVEEVATTLLYSFELTMEENSFSSRDYYYQTPNIAIAANFSAHSGTALTFNDTSRAYISTSTKGALGTAAILYQGIKDLSPLTTTQEERLSGATGSTRAVASSLLSIVAMLDGNITHAVNGTIKFKMDKDGQLTPRSASAGAQCVYWSKNVNYSLGGAWSTRGLSLIDTYFNNHSNETYSTCYTNHLTSFTILMEVSNFKPSRANLFALELVSYVGCSVSLLCLFLTIVSFPFIRLRDIRFKIHFQLCLALAAAQILFLSGIAAVQNKAACMVVAIFLHYFYTVTFLWMLVEGIHLYQKIVIAYEVTKIKKELYFVIAWGIPLLLVGTSVAVNRKGYGTSRGCWLTLDKGFRWAFIGPVLFVLVVNLIILVKVLTVMVKMKNDPLKEQKYNKIKAALKGIVILMPLLGLTWCFGVMSVNSETIVFQYLFAFFNSFQGAFIFIFNYVLNKEVRTNFKRTLYRTTTTSL